MSYFDDYGVGAATQNFGASVNPEDQAMIDLANSSLPTTGTAPEISGEDQAMIDLAGSSLPTTGTAPSFDLSKLTDAFKGLFGQAGSAMSTPAGFLTGLAALYALTGGNRATPASQGYRGSIPKLTRSEEHTSELQSH